MSLLREIQNAAVDETVSLAVLLRKCKILAARLGNIEFKVWIDKELNGYDNLDDLPSYRIIQTLSKGNFSGVWQSSLRNADIPMHCIPEKYRKIVQFVKFSQPIASIESLIKTDDPSSNLRFSWDPNLVAIVGRNIYENMNCLEAWQRVPHTGIISLLETIRNRILNFVLEIEGENPQAGEAEINGQPIPQEKVQQIFHMNFHGSIENFASGNRDVQQTVNKTYNNELFDQMLSEIQKISSEHQNNTDLLTESILSMKDNQNQQDFKTHYAEFMSIFSNHITVYGAVLAPFIPQLTALLN